MWPTVLLPGTDVTVASYHLLHVLGWFTFLVVGSALTRTRPDLRRHWWWLFGAFAVADTAGARFLFRLVRGWDATGFFAAPLLFAAATGIYVLARKVPAYPFLDAWAVAFSAAHVFEKCACLAAGCCYGWPTDSRLGVALHAAHGDPTRSYPLPLYEAGLHLVTAVALERLYAHGWLKGRLVLVLGAVFGAWRALMEVARAGRRVPILGGPLTATQVVCLMAVAFSAAYFLMDWVDSRRAKARAPLLRPQ